MTTGRFTHGASRALRAWAEVTLATLGGGACAPVVGSASSSNASVSASAGSGGSASSTSAVSMSSSGTGGAPNHCGPGSTLPSSTFVGDRFVVSIATDGADVFVAANSCGIDGSGGASALSESTIERVPVSGGSHTTVLDATSAPAQGIGLAGSNVYFTTANGLAYVPKVGGAATDVTTVYARAITSDGATVCWSADDGFHCMPAPGGPATTLLPAPLSDEVRLKVVSDSLFAMIGNLDGTYTLERIPITGGAPVEIASADDIAFDIGGDIAWLWTGAKLTKVPLSGGAAEVLEVSEQRGISSPLVVDGDCVYWADGDVIKRMPLTGDSPADFAKGEHDHIGALVQDDSHVYAAESGYGVDTGCPAFVLGVPK